VLYSDCAISEKEDGGNFQCDRFAAEVAAKNHFGIRERDAVMCCAYCVQDLPKMTTFSDNLKIMIYI
jgi:hypothetical protein